ncbi:MAG TPA: YdcF family protein [Candidatus Sulfotelmatobacter sp.]|nr:YdcF family protein [Candidatus Sulfotelmatobacter sp.]
MSFVLSKVLWVLVNPGNLFLLGLAVGAALLWRRTARLGRFLVTFVTLAGLAVAFLPIGDWLGAPLEARFAPPREAPPRVDGIIVLGGALAPDRATAHNRPAFNQSVERMLAFVSLARRYPQARLLFTGGNGALFPGAESEADVARQFFADFAPDLTRIEYEGRSRNTHENALFSYRQMAPRPGETWLLITSAMHMPRAVGCFRAVGWPVLPWPVDYRTGGAPAISFTGDLSSIDNATKEWLGLLAYRIEGYTNALFPAP